MLRGRKGGGMKAHRWISDTCIKCGLMRKKKTRKVLMAITKNQLPYDHCKYEEYYEYSDGIKTMEKRPDCKTTQQP